MNTAIDSKAAGAASGGAYTEGAPTCGETEKTPARAPGARNWAIVEVGPFRIRHDEYQWVLETKTKPSRLGPGGKWGDPRYYGKLVHACEEMFERHVAESGVSDFAGLLRAVREARNAIVGAVEKVEADP